MALKMNFKADLIDIVEDFFSKNGISYEKVGSASDYAARYFEMLVRRIDPKSRSVFFSKQIHKSLDRHIHEATKKQLGKALQARQAVSDIEHIFESGGDVTLYLSKTIRNSNCKDEMLWEWGIHHFHLSTQRDTRGFIKRSDYLLFAMIYDDAALFIDVRKHRRPDGLEWVRQDLFEIVHSNWPQVLYSHELPSVTGDVVSDKEKGELRRKNVNHVMELRGHAFAPIGGGVLLSGGSTLCRVRADKLVWEIERHEKFLGECDEELQAAFKASGVNLSGGMELRLVLLEEMSPDATVMESLQEDDCLSRELCKMGFVIVEAESRRIIDVREPFAKDL